MANYDDGVSPVIGVILMVAITVVLTAVIASFVFQMAGDIPSGHTVAITQKKINTTHIEITNHGGTGIKVLESITISGDVSGTLGVEVGDSTIIDISGTTDPRVKVIGAYIDGTKSILSDVSY